MPDYAKTVIYKITTGNDLYIGSTCNFTRRKNCHKSAIYNDKIKDYNTLLYQTIRENDGEWDIKVVVEFPCNTKQEKTIEEERLRILLGANLNGYKCHTTKEERTEYMRLFSLNYRNGDKRDEMLKAKKEWYENNKVNIRLQQNEYRANNIELCRQQKKDSYHLNKEKHKEITICDCDCEVRKREITRHKKTAKHIKLMEAKK